MQLTDYVTPGSIVHVDDAVSKEELLRTFVERLAADEKITDKQRTLSALIDRERLGSTGVGEEVAIPHAKMSDVEDIIIMLGVAPTGVDFDAVDGKPVKLFFMVLASDRKMNLHLKTLARISRLIKMTSFRDRVLAASTDEEIISVLEEEEARL